MHLDHIYIKGFRNFKEVTVNFNKHSLLIGANDVGKTNLIYAMRLLLDKGFSDYDFELSESDFYAYEETNEVVIKIFFSEITDDCIVARMPGKISDDGKMVLQYRAARDNKTVDYHFYCGKSDSEEDLIEINGPYYRRFLNLKYISSRRDFWSFINKSKNLLLNQAKENREPDTVEADNALYDDISKQLEYVDSKIPELSYVKNATEQLNKELDKLSIHHREQQIVFDTSTTETDRVISRVSLASKHDGKNMIIGGEGRINQIYLSLWATQNQITDLSNEVSIICVEEPEAYLHPHQQRELAFYLGKTLRGEVILTSHSPFIVSEFSPNSIIRLYKNKNETLVASEGCSKVIEDGVDGLGYRMSVIPAEAFFADYVILVEGPSELLLFKTLAVQLGVELDRLNISVLYVDGVDFVTYIKILKAMCIKWSMRTDNDIMKIPKKDEYRFAGIERALKCLEEGRDLDDKQQEMIRVNKTLLRGFNDPNNVPKQNREAAEIVRQLLDDFCIQTADVDLETDLLNGPLREALTEYYGEGEGVSDDEIIAEMQKHKGLNMYHFLQKKKNELGLLKDDRMAELLYEAKNCIEINYGANANPA
ncbi:MAG: AAA family ATPase [Bacteroidales bacterium]|nr:AAA family ATPase [Bacteroidales bacterium]